MNTGSARGLSAETDVQFAPVRNLTDRPIMHEPARAGGRLRRHAAPETTMAMAGLGRDAA